MTAFSIGQGDKCTSPTRFQTARIALTGIVSVIALPIEAQQDPVGANYAAPAVLLEWEGPAKQITPLASVDLDGDGLDEVFFFDESDLADDTVGEIRPYFIYKRSESGLMVDVTSDLVVAESHTLDHLPYPAIPGDFNGDGRNDLFLPTTGWELRCPEEEVRTGRCTQGGANRLLLAGEDGKVYDVTETHMPEGFKDYAHGSGAGDYDGDGDLDVYINADGPSYITYPDFAYMMHNDGEGHFTVVSDLAESALNQGCEECDPPIAGFNGILPEGDYYGGSWVIPLDANGDGKMDIVTTRMGFLGEGFNDILNFNVVMIQGEGGSFDFHWHDQEPFDAYPGTGCGESPYQWDAEACRHSGQPQTQHYQIHDLNNDGLTDMLLHQLVYAVEEEFLQESLQVLVSNGDGTFRDETETRAPGVGGASLNRFQLHDLDNDGHPDLFAIVDPDGNGYLAFNDIRLNDGEGYFRSIGQTWVHTQSNIRVLDVDGDGDTDIIESRQNDILLHKMIQPYGPDLDGDGEDNRLIGGAVANTFRGMAGDDVLDGGLGNDLLDGGPGNDTLIGGKGNDRYVYHVADLAGTDTIIDKAGGSDRLQFEDFQLSAVTHASQGANGELILTFAAGGSITVENHFQGGTTGIEKIQAGGTEYPVTQSPAFQGGSIEDLTDGVGDFALEPGHNGNWWNGPARDGEGAQIEVSDAGEGSLVFVATVYSYDTMGNQIFLVAVGPVAGDSAQVDVFITDGGVWGDDFDPESVSESQWGTGTFTGNSCGSIHMALMPNAEFQAQGYTNLEYDLVRLTTSLIACPFNSPN